jgi:hypothetical protein
VSRHGGTAEDISKPIPVVTTPMAPAACVQPQLQRSPARRVVVWSEWLRTDALRGASVAIASNTALFSACNGAT